eukprot:gene25706-31438_t
MGQYGDLITTHMSVVSDSSNAFCLDITTSHKYEIRVIESVLVPAADVAGGRSDIVANFAVADAAGCELNHTSTSLPPLQYNTSTITHASLDFLMNGICSNWIDLVSGVGADECTSLARANPHCGAHIVCTTYQTFAVRGRGERPAVCHDASDFSVSLPQLGVDTAYGCSDVVGALRDLGLSGNCSRAYADMSVTYGSAPDELRDLASSCSHSCDTCFPASTASFLLNEQQSSYQQATATCDHRGGQLAWFDTRVDVTGLAELMGSKGFTSVWVGAKAVNSSFVYAHSGAAFPFDVEVPAGLASPACVTLESMLGVEKFVAASCAMAGPSACRLSGNPAVYSLRQTMLAGNSADHLRDDGSKSRSRFVGTKGSNRLIAGMLISQDRNPS